MIKRFILDYVIFPIFLIFPVLLDGILTIYTYPLFITQEHEIIWQLTHIVFFMAMIFIPHRHYVYWAFAIGLLYDFYYSPILSFYTAPLVIIVYIYRLIRPNFKHKTFFNQFILTTILLASMQSMQYIVALIYQMTYIDVMAYLSHKMMPTIIFNCLLFFILYPLFKRLFLWINNAKS